LSRITTSPGFSVGEELLDIGAEAFAVDGPSNRLAASIRSLRRAARKVAVFPG
jgi:hypothetical protein